MDIDGIDHVEFYVGDAQQWSHFLCFAFGFRVHGQGGPETGLPGQRSLLLRQGDMRILLTSALDREHPAAEYVSRHGDGVANIAFAVTDARSAFDTAVAQGATVVEELAVRERCGTRVVTASVLGFGDVAHRFVERTGDAEEFMPGVVEMLAAETVSDAASGTESGDGEPLLGLFDHAAICLPAGELGPTVEFYQKVFGFSQIFEEFIEVGEQAMDSKVVQSPSGKVTFTLIEPVTDRRPGQIDEFLARHGGAGVQHIAMLSHDIVGAVHTLQGRGVRFLKTPDSYYSGVEERLGGVDLGIAELRDANVLVDRDHWGEVFQIFTQSMHIRRTFFWEVIDRHGARTFGSGNIKALYEAVAREKAPA